MIASCTSSWNSESCTLATIEPALGAQLGREDVVRLEVRIRRRECRARGHELIELRRCGEAIRFAERAGERPSGLRRPREHGLRRELRARDRRLIDRRGAADVVAVEAFPVLDTAADGELELGRDLPPSCAQSAFVSVLPSPSVNTPLYGCRRRPVGGVERRVLERVVLPVHAGAQRVARIWPPGSTCPCVERVPTRAVEHRDAPVRR